MASFDSLQQHGQKMLDSGLQAVPGSPTALSDVDTWIYQLSFTNEGSAAALTITDGDGNAVIPATSWATNTGGIAVWPEGLKCTGGITWDGGGGTFIASVVAFRVGL